jgi:phage shock protein PspC (stress-responsive transcriptional regulator)
MFRMTDRNSKVLVRPKEGRTLAGVCAGIAAYLGLDVTLVRVIWAVVAVLTGGAGVLAYLAAWIIIPDGDQQSPIPENLAAKKNSDAWSR